MPSPSKPTLLIDPPAVVGQYPYFGKLSRRPDCLSSHSMRDDAELATYAQSRVRPRDVTYQPEADQDSRRQDAAKIQIPKGQVSLPNNVLYPIPTHAPASLFATWDFWMGSEFAFPNTQIGNYKHYNFYSLDRIWTEPKLYFSEASEQHPGALAVSKTRYYGRQDGGEWGSNVTHNNPITPLDGLFLLKPETWTRYWFLFAPTGEPATITYSDGSIHQHEWWAYSFWANDVTSPTVTQIYDGKRIVPNYERGATGWHRLNVEYNTSGKGLGEQTPARTSYMRNVVFLKGITDPSSLLEPIH